MAGHRHHRHRRHRVSAQAPVIVGDNAQPTTADGDLKPQTIGGGDVLLFSDDQQIKLTARLRGPVDPPLPRPRIETVDRRGTVGLVHWTGRDPYQVVIPIMFDRYASGRSVLPQIHDLSRLAMRPSGEDDPPTVGVVGPVPAAPGMADPPMWRIIYLAAVPERTLYNGDGRPCRFAIDVTLLEAVQDRILSRTQTAGKGVKTRREEIHKGESLYHFAKRVTGKRSNAAAIARANALKVSYVARSASKLRIP
jgi:hypothetical protein